MSAGISLTPTQAPQQSRSSPLVLLGAPGFSIPLAPGPALRSREGAAAQAVSAAERKVPEGRTSLDPQTRARPGGRLLLLPYTLLVPGKGRMARRYLPWTWAPGCRTA